MSDQEGEPLDRLDDLAVAAIAADPLGADFQRIRLVDGASEDLGSRQGMDSSVTRASSTKE